MEAFWHHKTGPNVHHESYVISNKAVAVGTIATSDSVFPSTAGRSVRRVSGGQIAVADPYDPAARTTPVAAGRSLSTNAMQTATTARLGSFEGPLLSKIDESTIERESSSLSDAASLFPAVGSVLLSRLNESDCAVVVPRLLLPYIYR